jgi:hypothetical protein
MAAQFESEASRSTNPRPSIGDDTAALRSWSTT